MNTKSANPVFANVVLLAWLAFAPLAQAYYNPSAGRWLNRDPIEEKGGKNIQLFAANSPTCNYDFLGLTCDCFVESVKLQNVTPYNGDTVFSLREGHRFEIAIGLTYVNADTGSGRDCKLKWIETWNTTGYKPNGERVVPGVPFDNFELIPNGFFFQAWSLRRKLCCSHETIIITDVPVISIGYENEIGPPTYWEDSQRILDFNIIVESGDGSNSISLNFSQNLHWRNGVELVRKLQ